MYVERERERDERREGERNLDYYDIVYTFSAGSYHSLVTWGSVPVLGSFETLLDLTLFL